MQLLFTQNTQTDKQLWRRTLIPAGICTLLLFGTITPASAQYALLKLHGEPTSLIGANDYDILYTPANTGGNFFADALKLTGTNATFARFSFAQSNPTFPQLNDNYSRLFFGTNQLGVNLVPGVYTDAQRASFAQPGHPGLDVSFNYRGFNQLTGEFTVTEAEFTLYPGETEIYNVTRFAASFVESGDGSTGRMFGTFIYSSTGAITVPELPSGALVIASLPLVAYCLSRGSMRRKSVSK